jgi:hypothetical protein
VRHSLRIFAVVVVAVALLTQTWLWMGVSGAPLGYTFEQREAYYSYRQFLVGGASGDLAPAGNMTIRADPHHFEQDWDLAGGGAVHIEEEFPPYAILLGGQPSDAAMIAAAHTRSNWQETTALGGRVNALRATIGRTRVSIEGSLGYDELFRIAESLRPGFAPL